MRFNSVEDAPLHDNYITIICGATIGLAICQLVLAQQTVDLQASQAILQSVHAMRQRVIDVAKLYENKSWSMGAIWCTIIQGISYLGMYETRSAMEAFTLAKESLDLAVPGPNLFSRFSAYHAMMMKQKPIKSTAKINQRNRANFNALVDRLPRPPVPLTLATDTAIDCERYVLKSLGYTATVFEIEISGISNSADSFNRDKADEAIGVYRRRIEKNKSKHLSTEIWMEYPVHEATHVLSDRQSDGVYMDGWS
jgi:hypothetical protein